MTEGHIRALSQSAIESARKAMMRGASLRQAAELIDSDAAELDLNLWRRLIRAADRGDVRRLG